MLAAMQLRCLPVLLLMNYALANVEGTNTAASSRGQDRRNAANKFRRTTTSDPYEPTTSPQLATATPVAMQRFPVPLEPEVGERARQNNSVKVTRKLMHGGKMKTRKYGTDADHMTVTMETGLPLEVASARVDGSNQPGEGKSFAITRTTAETTEPRQRTTEASIPQRILRVKTTTAATTTKTTTTTPSTTTSKLPARKHSTTSALGGRSTPTTMYSNRTTSKSSSTKEEGCSSSCEMHRCETVEAEMCQGRVVKDRCNCCPVCLIEQRTDEWREDVTTKKTSHHPSNACDGMQCPKHKVCILNIQGIPMCRCPNIYSCRGLDRNPLCAEDGVTYKNKCFLKVEECTIGRRIRIEHRGSCRSKSTTVQLETPVVTLEASRFDQDPRTLEATHHKSGKTDPWRYAATEGDKMRSAKLRKRHGSKSQFPHVFRHNRFY